MAGPRLLPPGLPLLPLLPLLLLPALPLRTGPAAPSRCRPDQFQCAPGARCFPRQWRCDGHSDCVNGEDEWGCGTSTAAEPSPGGPGVTPAWSPAEPSPGGPGVTPAWSPAEPSPGGPGVTPAWSPAVPPAGSAEASATPEPEVSVPSRSQGYMWILAVAGLLSILVAVGSVAVWGLSKAKSRSDTFNLEKASREHLMPDKSQTGSFP